jgi:hypothetical protein
MEVENTAPPTGAQWRPVQSRLAGKRGSTTATEDNTLLPQLAASRLIVDSPVGVLFLGIARSKCKTGRDCGPFNADSRVIFPVVESESSP